MKTNNQIVVNLNKVAYANLVWWNGKQSYRSKKPDNPSVNGTVFNPNELNYNGENNLAVAKRLGLLDVWIPVLHLQFANTHKLRYTGKKALAIWSAWKAKIYGNTTKQTTTGSN